MPVLAKFNGIVIRLLIAQTFGVRLHAFYGDNELVVGLKPMRVITSEVPEWVEAWVLNWIFQHEREFLSSGTSATAPVNLLSRDTSRAFSGAQV